MRDDLLLTDCRRAEDDGTPASVAGALPLGKWSDDEKATNRTYLHRNRFWRNKRPSFEWPPTFERAAQAAWSGDTAPLVLIAHGFSAAYADWLQCSRSEPIRERTIFDQDTPKNEAANVEWDDAFNLCVPVPATKRDPHRTPKPKRELLCVLIADPEVPITAKARAGLANILERGGHDDEVLKLLDRDRAKAARVFAKLDWNKRGKRAHVCWRIS